MTLQSIGGKYLFTISSLLMASALAHAQGTVPTFETKVKERTYTLAGGDINKGGTTTIGTVLVPLKLSFEARGSLLDATADVPRVLGSPLFTPFAFAGITKAQYLDAMMRATFPEATKWHTVLGRPEVKPITIRVPLGFGYVLHSRKSGRWVGIVDVEWLQKEVFRQVPKQAGKLVIAISHNVAYYALGDATVCCSWGTHGVDSATGNSFVLASYLHDIPGIVQDQDVQPLSQQLAQFMKDPLNDPLLDPRQQNRPGNRFPAWMRPAAMKPGDQGGCGGTGAASMYFLLEPTNTNPKNNFPASKPFVAGGYHLENVALMGWYAGAGSVYSFPDPKALAAPAEACPERGRRRPANTKPTTTTIPLSGAPNGHKLIGYWAGYGGPGSTIPMRELSPQWDIIIVAFAIPDKKAPEGTMLFRTPGGLDNETFKGDIQWLKSQGKKVMISLGGGGQHFTLADPKRVPNFVASVTRIVEDYGFDGIDVDFESPSLSIAPGDTDFRNPTTPSIVNLISALRQVQAHFGPKFMLSLVPEGTQIPSGYPSYGGQFGSYLPIAYALRDSLAFMDVQDYNTPPLQGLDGEIYQAGTVDYHAAMTELVLQGFPVGGDPRQMFPAFPSDKVAVGFLTGDATPTVVSQALDYIITGKAPSGTNYRLRKPGGYPGMLGAMFWTIDADRRGNYLFSNVIGPQLHRYQ